MCPGHFYRNQRGAALILVMGILTILLALGLTFFSLTREEIRVATNVTNIVRSELLADGAAALAMWQLNQDFLEHPNYTSTDHAWRTFFNGAWAAGKPWALQNAATPLWNQGRPLIDMGAMPFIVFADGHNERLYQGPRTRHWLYIPRMDIDNPARHIIYAGEDELAEDPFPNAPANFEWIGYEAAFSEETPFVLPDFYGATPLLAADLPLLDDAGNLRSDAFPKEIVATWADVDSTGDGFRDAVWFPIPGDVFLTNDGLDNDLSGVFDDKANEIGVFAYLGNANGALYQNQQSLDDLLQNGPASTGEAANALVINDYKVYLTAPLPGIRIPLDFTGNGQPDRIDLDGDGTLEPVYVVMPDTILVQVHPAIANLIAQGLTAHPASAIQDIGGESYVALTAEDVDNIDNDHDMFVNNYYSYAYIGPNLPAWIPSEDWNEVLPPEEIARYNAALDASFVDINIDGVLQDRGGFNFVTVQGDIIDPGFLADVVADEENRTVSAAEFLNRLRVTHSGEPVTEIVGRAAVHIQDESSKVNMNVAGAHRMDDFLEHTDTDRPVVRALGDGIGPHEYDTRVLPDIGIVRARNMWNMLTGTPSNLNNITTEYFYDIQFPGYGRVDDTGTALLYAMNDMDISGSGLIDDGIGLGPMLSANARAVLRGERDTADFPDAIRAQVLEELLRYREYFYRLGAFEGVDDPFELRRFRSLRNRLAENDGIDNDNNGIIDEIGELGDRQLQAREQLRNAIQIGDTLNERLRDLISIHSTDKNLSYFETERGLRALNKFNPNYATPQQMAANILLAGAREPITRQNTEQLALTLDAGSDYLTGERLHLRSGSDSGFNFAPAATFAEGLRRADVHVTAPTYFDGAVELGGLLRVRGSDGGVLPATYAPLHQFPADPLLQAMQTAVDLADSRDNNHGRSVLSTEKMSRIYSINDWPGTLNPRERVPEDELFPLQEIEAFARDTLRLNRDYESVDTWWENLVQGRDDVDLGERRRISHTVTGNEAIKLNELMVRPARRVEAEAMIVGQYPIPPFPGYQQLNPMMPLNTGMPAFDVRRRFLLDALPYNFATGDASASSWGIFYNGVPFNPQAQNGVLGDQATYVLGEPYSLLSVPDPAGVLPNQEVIVPDIIEFDFRDPYPSLGNAPGSFEFGEIISPKGMPPGRYYLTVNINDYLGNPTRIDGDLYYSIKYINVNGEGPAELQSSIVEDIGSFLEVNNNNAQFNQFLDNMFQAVPAEHFAMPPDHEDWRPGEAPGWVFLDGTPADKVDEPIQANGYFTEFSLGDTVEEPFYPDFPGGSTHTVTIPPIESGYALAVALYYVPGEVDETQDIDFNLNFFDFSQEPAHEYVELANVTDEIVDLSGWQLEVGIPDRDGVPSDPFRSLWTLPDDTFIAPQGKLLLAFNKFDSYRQGANVVNPREHKINTNGMGLAASNKPISTDFTTVDLRGVTVPPIHDHSYIYNAVGTGFIVPGYENFFDPTGSVFQRNDFNDTLIHTAADYVDRMGDGVTTAAFTGDPVLDTDNVWIDLTVQSTPNRESHPAGAARPWDRIVQLDNVELDIDFDSPEMSNWRESPWQVYRAAKYSLHDVNSVDRLARLILRGGVLPNYPERDRIDNDGDGGYISFDGGVPVYVPGTLDKDMVDNNLDGRIDTRGSGSPIFDGDGFLIGYEDGLEPNPFLSEGVDEGRGVGSQIGRRYGAGSYESGTLPIAFFNNRAMYQNYTDTLDPAAEPANAFPYFGMADTGAFYIEAFNPGFYVEAEQDGFISRLGNQIDDPYAAIYGLPRITQDALYLGTDVDPLEWKNFVERRWYPGDNVKVTLYQGPARDDRVADRVTYREYDVINRTPDVGVNSPYFVNGVRQALHPDYPTYWLPNHMGLDFYRSLERKHPLYNGDRFGTSNRWEATNGNYDDWAHSISVFEFETDYSEWPAFRTGTSGSRFAGSGLNRRLFYHGLWGSPLRRNTAHRLTTNPHSLIGPDGAPNFPDDPADLARQFGFHEDYSDVMAELPLFADFTDRSVRSDLGWSLDKATVFDRQFHSTGQFARVPQLIFEERLWRSPGYSPGMDPINERKLIVGSSTGDIPYARQNLALRGATLGYEEPNRDLENLLVEASEQAALDHIVLTAGQAKLTPLAPYVDDAGGVETLLTWTEAATGAALPPGLWAPVFLFGMDGDDTSRGVDRYPTYPRYLTEAGYSNQGPLVFGDGSSLLPYLFNTDYLFAASPLFALLDLEDPEVVQALAERWPLEQRAMMYVSTNQVGDGPGDAAEALFEWDADDGLENGEYVLYIGTQYPDMTERLLEAHDAALNQPDVSTTDFELVGRGEPLLTEFALDDLLTQQNNTRLGLEVITDPTRAGVMAEDSGGYGILPPAVWNSGPAYTPNSDGYIMYGSQGRSEWQPITVRVTDNYLGLRVRNLGREGEMASITHVVLAPRGRTQGKININTSEPQVIRKPDGGAEAFELYHPFLGIPGIVDPLAPVVPEDDIPLQTVTGVAADDFQQYLPSIDAFFTQNGDSYPVFPALGETLAVPAVDADLGPDQRQARMQLSALISRGKPEHPDGRYYRSPAELVLPERVFQIDSDSSLLHYPLSTAGDVDQRFEEMTERYRRMANLISTRSDLFEIIVTVQSGYMQSTESGNAANYRSDEEFITTAESRTRLVYERRTPADRGAQATMDR